MLSQGIQISTDSGSLATLVPLPLAAGPVAIASNAAVPSGLPAGNYKGACMCGAFARVCVFLRLKFGATLTYKCGMRMLFVMGFRRVSNLVGTDCGQLQGCAFDAFLGSMFAH